MQDKEFQLVTQSLWIEVFNFKLVVRTILLLMQVLGLMLISSRYWLKGTHRRTWKEP